MATLSEDDPKAPFSIATTPRCRGGFYSIPWIAPLYLWSLPYNAECQARQHQEPFFESSVWLNLGKNPGLQNHGRTLYSLGQWPSLNQLIGLVGRVFANGQRDLGSIPGRIIPKTLKWYLIPPCLTLSNLRYISKVKWSNPGKWVAPSPIPHSSYWKGSLLVALDYGC